MPLRPGDSPKPNRNPCPKIIYAARARGSSSLITRLSLGGRQEGGERLRGRLPGLGLLWRVRGQDAVEGLEDGPELVAELLAEPLAHLLEGVLLDGLAVRSVW